ncbi:MAG: tRNA epoxyqueuosine(34) reductase QueG [Phycisphaeraceae bacterium]
MCSAPDSSPAAGSALVRQLGEEMGFGLVGIAPARPSEHGDAVRRWLAAGCQGEMDYLERNLEVRLDPGELLAGARSVIAVADFYERGCVAEWSSARVGEEPGGEAAHWATGPRGDSATPVPLGRVARYAWGGDYHKVMKKRLFGLADGLRAALPGAAFKVTVDTAPALEREHAERAGLGWTGKHTLLIHPRHGSWMLLGLIFTTAELESSEEAGWPGRTAPPADHCGSCTRCIDACPTDAISPYRVDARKCISYLTLEHRSLIDPELHAPMGAWIAGCDVCQEVCPHNRKDRQPAVPLKHRPRPEFAEGMDLLEVLGWSAEDRQAAFVRSALKRVKLDMLKRNALISAGNWLREHDRPALRERIEQLAADENEPELVRETARQVLNHQGTKGDSD